MSDSSFAPPASQLGTPNVGTLQVAAYPTAGQGLALDAKGKIPASVLSSGGLAVINDLTVSGSVLASYDTNTLLGGNIPATYKDLVLIVTGRGDAAFSAVTLLARLNNDAGANYDYSFYSFAAAAASGNGSGVAATSATLGRITGALGTAGLVGNVEIVFPNYNDATFQKSARSNYSAIWGTVANNQEVGQGQMNWRTAAGITRIALLLNTGNFAIGTRFTLYGRG